MGSSGTGRLSDYSGFNGFQKSPIKGSEGPKGPVDQCLMAFSTELEDVLTSPYYKTHGTVPAKEDKVIIKKNIRIVAIDESGLVIGNLPTKFNYLLGCINDGYLYSGIVEESIAGALPLVSIAVIPEKK